jgi:hypothetical protein
LTFCGLCAAFSSLANNRVADYVCNSHVQDCSEVTELLINQYGLSIEDDTFGT